MSKTENKNNSTQNPPALAVEKVQYAYWQHLLRINKGEPSVWSGDDPHEKGFPQTGFWRARKRAKGPYEPIAIWYIDGAPYVSRSGSAPHNLSQNVKDAKTHWLLFLEAVTYEDYQQALNTGIWPGEISPIGHNSAKLDDNDILRETVADTTTLIRKWLKDNQEIATKIAADEGANWRTVLIQLRKKATDSRRQEIATCKSDWKYTLDDIENTADHLRQYLVKYINASHETLPKLGGQFGRKTGIKTTWTAEIVDYNKALLHLSDNPDILGTVEKIATTEAKKKNRTEIPGVKFVKSKSII